VGSVSSSDGSMSRKQARTEPPAASRCHARSASCRCGVPAERWSSHA
jgi:hypothetical protein